MAELLLVDCKQRVKHKPILWKECFTVQMEHNHNKNSSKKNRNLFITATAHATYGLESGRNETWPMTSSALDEDP